MMWADAFDFNAWQKSVDEKMEAQAEEIASLILEMKDLKEQLNSGSFIGTPPPGAFVPRNWRRFNG